MNAATRLGGYAVGLVAVFALAAGVGRLADPDLSDPVSEHGSVQAGHGNEGDTGGGGHGNEGDTGGGGHGNESAGHRDKAPAVEIPGGLQAAAQGYRIVPAETSLMPGEQTDFRFTIKGPDGKSVTKFETLHEKKLHFIAVRRDLEGFQHLHPEQVGEGVWSVPLMLPEAGTYRVFTDFQPAGVKEPLTLGVDLFAPGDFRHRPLSTPSRTAEVDGYTVELDGRLEPGETSKLSLTVSRNGKPVRDLEPYLGAYGHLVALRNGDLAYLHVHPDGAPGDGETTPGPEVTFYAEVPSPGTYALYLDFKHQGRVHTAKFVAKTGAGAKTRTGAKTGAHPNDEHGH